ncbi:serine-rich coiled-coil domain-containing protein 2, partial [Colossoma macropomum]|uniref:serine-rich coiled-coil domain-containing protein 2 n=1 Tax=Colossoma macropomum TaxID=42526 RepID=UPI0018642D40
LMEQKTPSKPTMVSRLPKFGSRPVNALSSQPNSTLHGQHTHDCRKISGKPSRVVQPSSFSMKWTKETGSSTVTLNQELSGGKRETHAFHPPGTRTNKKPSTLTATGRKSASSVLIGSPKPGPKSSRSRSSPKIGQTASLSSTSPSSSSSKLTQNGTVDLSTSGRGPRFQRLRDNPSSGDGLPRSSCGLKMLSADRMVRSQSFTYFRQPSPTSSSIPRSFSFSKAVELAKPLPNTQLCPLRAPGLKPPQCLSSSRLGLGFVKSFPECSSSVASLSGCSTPSSGPQKPLLPKCVLSKSSTLGYSLTHSFAAKPQHLLVVGRSQEKHQIKTLSLTPESNHNVQRFEKPAGPADLPDGTEEMSFSSGSSDRNENCEDLLDDFDHLGDQSHNGVPDNRCLTTPTQTRLCNVLHEDWVGVTDVDSVGSSSLELSPSSSSGGTYMWDEDMSYTHSHTHHCGDEPDINTTLTNQVAALRGSKTNQDEGTCLHWHNKQCLFYSTIKLPVMIFSQDAVNNLENVAAFDLEENDLVLELHEDGTLHSGGTIHSERSEKRTQQQRLSRVNQHNHNRLLMLQGFDEGPTVQSDDHMVAIEEFSLNQMLQDFSSVKSQLLKLKLLLQVEEGERNRKDLTEVNSAALQVEMLTKEVTILREELKNKDNIITQLTNKQQQQQHKQQQHRLQHRSLSGSEVKEVKGQKADKFTQTPRRPAHTVGLSLWSALPPPITSLQLPPASSSVAIQPTAQRGLHPGTISKFNHHRGPQ